jgi:hypothetical protein
MRSTVVILIFFSITSAVAQEVADNQQRFVLTAMHTAKPVTIDGILDEESWTAAKEASPFINKWPMDSGLAEAKTIVKILFDNQFVYVSAINYQKREDLIIQTLKRDQLVPFWAGDGFSILLDPINKKANGFLFGVNAGGAQIEASLTLNGAWTQPNENWDNKWFSAVKVHDEYWIAELAIPFSALRFKKGEGEWGLNFIRNDMKRNVYSTWSRVPLQFNGMDLGHLGTLQWNEPLDPVQSRVTVIPYVSGGYSKNHEDLEQAKTKGNAGIDMKVGVTSSLNLDLTYRPDFSNVDVDRQMTNVTRYSLLYPERRNFFLENADVFSGFGSWQTRTFFSRRIGLYDGEPIPILAGARLSGNITPQTRIGVMDIQTEATKEFSANNYLIAAVHQRVLSRSAIKLFTSSRQTTKAIEGDQESNYNRTIGGEFQYTSTSGNLTGSLRAHTAFTPEKLSDNDYVSATFQYMNKKGYGGLLVEKIGENYVNDLGFIPRLYNYDAIRDTTVRIGHYTVNPWFGLTIYPKNSKLINMIEPNTWSLINYRASGEFLERYTTVNVTVTFKSSSELLVDMSNNEVQLPFAADILDNDNPIPVARYNYTQFMVKYKTDSRKALNGDLSLTYGGFYNGTRLEYGGTLNFRTQPWGMFGVSYLQNDIRLPAEYGKANFILIGPRTEISLSNSMWWTTFVQYNTQVDNFNINTRFQWRYRPMSDLFIVYTDNYLCTDMKVKNRGIVFKLTYWLNL